MAAILSGEDELTVSYSWLHEMKKWHIEWIKLRRSISLEPVKAASLWNESPHYLTKLDAISAVQIRIHFLYFGYRSYFNYMLQYPSI